MAEQEYQRAEKLSGSNPQHAIDLYNDIILSSQADEKIKEQAIYSVSKLYGKQGRGAELSLLLKNIRPFFDTMAKAKTAKIVRSVIDLVSEYPGNERLQIDLCRESIQWCKETNRSYLRQRIETRLFSLLFAVKEYQAALSGLTTLLSEVKRLDDKPLLVEIQLLESRIHHALRNIPKARGALTAARTNGNSIYCPPRLQAEIDMMSGILHAEEKDYKTAYSYVFESFEGYNSLDDPLAVRALKYMLLCKIMTNAPEDVAAIVQGKTALRYAGRDVDAMRAVAKAHADRDLNAFEISTKEFGNELTQDPIIHTHLSELYNTLLEQNLCRIIEPFSSVEIQHIAHLISLPIATVEKKLSNMILDKKFDGILDQGLGTLIVYSDRSADTTYPTSLETIQTLSRVVDILYGKASRLS
jgi:26S proteasome regulatory subunit N6